MIQTNVLAGFMSKCPGTLVLKLKIKALSVLAVGEVSGFGGEELPQTEPWAERPGGLLRSALPVPARQHAFCPSHRGILSQGEEREAAALEEIELKLLRAPALDDDLADEGPLSARMLELPDVGLPRGIRLREGMGGLACAEQGQ